MLDTYRRLEKEGKIGPSMMLNGTLVPRPYAEYPKWVTTRENERRLVENRSQELRVIAEEGIQAPVEEMLETERNEAVAKVAGLEAQRDSLEAKVAALQAQIAALAKAPSEPVGGDLAAELKKVQAAGAAATGKK